MCVAEYNVIWWLTSSELCVNTELDWAVCVFSKVWAAEVTRFAVKIMDTNTDYKELQYYLQQTQVSEAICIGILKKREKKVNL